MHFSTIGKSAAAAVLLTLPLFTAPAFASPPPESRAAAPPLPAELLPDPDDDAGHVRLVGPGPAPDAGSVAVAMAIAEAVSASAAQADLSPPPAETSIAPTVQPLPVNLPVLLRELEEAYIAQALAQSGGNKKEAARLLGMGRTTLVEKLRRRNADTSTP